MTPVAFRVEWITADDGDGQRNHEIGCADCAPRIVGHARRNHAAANHPVIVTDIELI